MAELVKLVKGTKGFLGIGEHFCRTRLVTKKDGDSYTVMCGYCLGTEFVVPVAKKNPEITANRKKLISEPVYGMGLPTENSRMSAGEGSAISNMSFRGTELILAQCANCRAIHIFDPKKIIEVEIPVL